MNCALGGFVIARHDNVKNFEAKLLKQVWNDVQPPLQPTTGYSFRHQQTLGMMLDWMCELRGFGVKVIFINF